MIAELSRVLESLNFSVEWVGLRAVQESIANRWVRDGLPQRNGTSLNQGVMVEVLVDGQFGYSAVNSLDPDRIRQAALQAHRQAVAARQWAIHPMTIAARPRVVGQYTSPFLKPFDALSPGEIGDVLIRLSKELRVSEQIVQTNAGVSTNETESWFVSSNGSEVYQRFLLLETHFGVTAQDGAIVQQRSNNGYLAHCYQGGWELFPSHDLWERAQQVGEQAVELLTAEECPTTTTTLMLAPDQMMLQIHESVGHPLELDRILGDERNYAGGSFIKATDFGDFSYGSALMNITFDPTVPGEFASYQFDDTGAPAQREYLIKEGVLVRGLGSLESQQRSGVLGVANARASSWNRPAIDRMANLNLEPGSASLDAMLAEVEHGVYMEANRSWSIDDQRYKFQFGCEYARLIENGKFTKTLRNPNYRGTTPQFWHSLSQVGDRSTWEIYGTPYCGKGEPNQAIRVGHGSPVCVFEQVEVFGGG
ncbi:MAG: TldD/PmbA family protein [Leptolyngbyaceae cyanobacterium SL_7_1]|nr:TldD/PmbA family protein [Leptolyngbyaceae cyanobacterium SL_7_1]